MPDPAGTSRQQDLLLELFSEEIPARMQPRAADDLKRLVTDALVERGLTYAHAAAFTTPRRLTLSLTGLPPGTPDTVEERKGPRVDAPEKALEGFLRSTGLAREDLEARDDKKGKVWFAKIRRKGRPAAEVIAEAVPEVIRAFPWPKSMRWGAGSLRWVRPLRSILCILHDEHEARIVPFEIDGIAAGDSTEGHRFLGQGRFSVRSFDDYRARLQDNHVLLDPAARADTIWNEATNLAFARGLELVQDRGLLTEVAGMVEWPVVLMGRIEERFLDLPPEVLQTSMKEHQKFFSVRNPKTGRIEAFVTVANIEAPDGGDAILAGNARVLAARLSDAQFFWENDLRVVKCRKMEGMAEMAESLKAVTFHSELGSQAARIERIAALTREIAPHVKADPDLAEQAARIAKADLASEMVYEFPELQGIMGRYYAEAAGLPKEVAAAAEQHYKPLGPSDEVPSEPVSVAVALADKIDLLAGFWAIDEKPTGSKDPFALRRGALGVLRTVLANDVRFDLEQVLQSRIAKPQVRHDLVEFILQRLDVVLREEGVRFDAVRAIFRRGPGASTLGEIEIDFGPDALDRPFGIYDLWLTASQARGLSKFLDTDDGANLLTAYRRAANIIAQAGGAPEGAPDPGLYIEPQEKTLGDALEKAEPEIAAALAEEDFQRAMTLMAALRQPVDEFFDAVLVNAEDEALRLNRLRLLARITQTMRQVAVWEEIEGS